MSSALPCAPQEQKRLRFLFWDMNTGPRAGKSPLTHVRRQTHTGSSRKLLGSQHKHAKSLLARWGGQDEQIFWRRAVTKEGGREAI